MAPDEGRLKGIEGHGGVIFIHPGIWIGRLCRSPRRMVPFGDKRKPHKGARESRGGWGMFSWSRRAQALAPSPIRELVPLMKLPGMISLGGGYPNPRTFAFERLEVAFRDGSGLMLEEEELESACQYSRSEGLDELRKELAGWHGRKDGVELPPEDFLVLTGSQEALFMLGFLLIDEGDVVALSEPAYPGALAAFRPFRPRYMPVGMDEQGMKVEQLERMLEETPPERRPVFVYTVPCGHNPAGVTMSLERRKRLVKLSERFSIPIVEDDPYQLVKLDDDAQQPPTLQALSLESGEGEVVRLDSFSKIFAPGLRLGYVTGPRGILEKMLLFKQASTLHTPSLTQAMLAQWLAREGTDPLMSLIERNRAFYRRNRDALLEAAERYLPAGTAWTKPAWGMFVWFTFPPGTDTAKMLEEKMADSGVLLVPGNCFSTTGGLRDCARASFSMADPNALEEAMKRLGKILRDET